MAESLKWNGGGIDTSVFATKEELGKKQDNLTAGSGIGITKNTSGEVVISYTGEAGGITEEQAIAIADAQIAAGGYAKTSEVNTALSNKQDVLTAGNDIEIKKDATGNTVISFTGDTNGITEERAREIATEQANAKIAEGNFATKSEIPTKVSDLNNDSGFAKTSDLSPIATSGAYSDLTGAPDPYDDTEIRNSISSINATISDLNSGVTGLQETIVALQNEIDNLKNPATPPTITQPSLTISGTDSGTTIPAGQTKSVTITLTFNRGTISSGGNTAGAATGYSLNGGAYQTSNVFNVTVSESNKTFKGKVKFGQGDQPKDSSGANYGTPMAASEIESSTLTYKFSDPTPADAPTIWSNAENILQVVKMTNVKESDKQWAVDWVPQTEDNPEIFDVPASWNVTAVETINNFTNMWQAIGQSFDISDITHDGVAYKRYTDNREFDDGGRSIRVTWA